MTRNREPQDLNIKTDLVPVTGLPLYLVRTFRDLEPERIRNDWMQIGLNTAALVAYNVSIGIGLDYLIQNHS